MSLLDTRDYYKPFDNPWMFDYYSQQNQMHWFPEDVPLHNDVKDWQNMTDEEITEMIEEADRDGDGEISEEEFMRIMRKTNLF